MNNRRITAALAFAAVLAAPLSLLADDNHSKGDKPAHISHGEEVKLADYLVPGKTTVFDFYSEYCPPCRAISPRLEKLHEARSDIAVVKVDINRPDVKGIDWQSPVAKEFGLESIPHFKVYGPDGKLKAEGDPAYEMVEGWLQ
jgi:thiol-disulfide isomerase/thioredoxin